MMEQPETVPAEAMVGGTITGISQDETGLHVTVRLPQHPELPPEQVAAWLQSREGELWSSGRNSTLQRHWEDSGVFASVIKENEGRPRLARWPEPFSAWDLDEERQAAVIIPVPSGLIRSGGTFTLEWYDGPGETA